MAPAVSSRFTGLDAGVRVAFRLDPASYERLREVARRNQRTVSGELRWRIADVLDAAAAGGANEHGRAAGGGAA
jgi:hypothetical protein